MRWDGDRTGWDGIGIAQVRMGQDRDNTGQDGWDVMRQERRGLGQDGVRWDGDRSGWDRIG